MPLLSSSLSPAFVRRVSKILRNEQSHRPTYPVDGICYMALTPCDAHTCLLRRRPRVGVRRRRGREALVRLALVHVEPPLYILAHLVRVVVVAPCIQMFCDVVERLDDQRMLSAQNALAQL